MSRASSPAIGVVSSALKKKLDRELGIADADIHRTPDTELDVRAVLSDSTPPSKSLRTRTPANLVYSPAKAMQLQ
jgi:hypothetical protein